MIDIGGILGAGIRLVRDRPGAAAVWALINTLFVGATQVATLPMMQLVTQDPGSARNPEQMFAAMGPFYGVMLVMMIAQIVLWAAVYRACLRPEESTAAYLRIGGDELRLFVIGLLWAVFSFAILMVGGLSIGMGFVASDLGRPGPTSAAITTIFVMLGFFLIAFVLFVFLGVRLALVWPLAVQRKRILIGEAWRLSRGHFWAMFGSAAVVLVILYAASMVVNVLQLGSFGIPGMAATDPEAADQVMMAQFTTFGPLRIIGIILGGIVSAGYMIAMAAGLAEALRQLQPDDMDGLADIYA